MSFFFNWFCSIIEITILTFYTIWAGPKGNTCWNHFHWLYLPILHSISDKKRIERVIIWVISVTSDLMEYLILIVEMLLDINLIFSNFINRMFYRMNHFSITIRVYDRIVKSVKQFRKDWFVKRIFLFYFYQYFYVPSFVSLLSIESLLASSRKISLNIQTAE